MTTETNPTPEVIIPPYEPREPLPGVAPAMRRVEGGYVREDAHPGAGEPDWKAEAERLLPCGHPASLALRSVESSTVLCELCEARSAARDAEKMEASLREELAAARAERDSLRAEVERLKAALRCYAEPCHWRAAGGKDSSTFATCFDPPAWGTDMHDGWEVALDALDGADAAPASPADARETAGNAPPRDERASGGGEVAAEALTGAGGAEAKHKHRCMRCREEFDCRTPGECIARYDVLPTIVNPDGRAEEHCPKAVQP